MQPAASTGEVVGINACTAHGWVRGFVELGRYRRLTDLLNNTAAVYLVLHGGQILPTGAQVWPPAHRRVLLRKHDVLFVLPTTETQPRSPAGLLVAKEPVRVGLGVGAYLLSGALHLLEHVVWEQYLANLQSQFLPLTDVRVAQAATDAEVARVSYAAVNREHITVLYELPAGQ
ncbi:MAG TPA: hypothetical protein VKZ60_12390 [Chloroflexota bacterium]|jgi:hypothetical protein|nr:hypothetical protein [Chloroflexota bacterium]